MMTVPVTGADHVLSESAGGILQNQGDTKPIVMFLVHGWTEKHCMAADCSHAIWQWNNYFLKNHISLTCIYCCPKNLKISQVSDCSTSSYLNLNLVCSSKLKLWNRHDLQLQI